MAIPDTVIQLSEDFRRITISEHGATKEITPLARCVVEATDLPKELAGIVADYARKTPEEEEARKRAKERIQVLIENVNVIRGLQRARYVVPRDAHRSWRPSDEYLDLYVARPDERAVVQRLEELERAYPDVSRRIRCKECCKTLALYCIAVTVLVGVVALAIISNR